MDKCGNSYNHEKLSELILYIAQKNEDNPKFGATLLNKILFLSDFHTHSKYGESITGESYFRLDKGPAPRFLKLIKETMKSGGDLKEEKKSFFKYKQHRLLPLREPNLSLFEDWQIQIVDKAIEYLWNKSATDVSDWSHLYAGWKFTPDSLDIPYSSVFWKDPKDITISEKTKKRAIEVARRIDT